MVSSRSRHLRLALRQSIQSADRPGLKQKGHGPLRSCFAPLRYLLSLCVRVYFLSATERSECVGAREFLVTRSGCSQAEVRIHRVPCLALQVTLIRSPSRHRRLCLARSARRLRRRRGRIHQARCLPRCPPLRCRHGRTSISCQAKGSEGRLSRPISAATWETMRWSSRGHMRVETVFG